MEPLLSPLTIGSCLLQNRLILQQPASAAARTGLSTKTPSNFTAPAPKAGQVWYWLEGREWIPIGRPRA